MSLTHWKKYDNPNYLGAYSLQPGEELVLTIKKIAYEVVKGEGGSQDQCRIAYFEEDSKPMILNVTNCKIISKVHKTPYIEQWPGKKIQVYATTTRLKGEEVECLRIRPKVPERQKPVMDENYKGWPTAVEALKKGETTLEFLLSKYDIPENCLKKLKEVCNA